MKPETRAYFKVIWKSIKERLSFAFAILGCSIPGPMVLWWSDFYVLEESLPMEILLTLLSMVVSVTITALILCVGEAVWDGILSWHKENKEKAKNIVNKQKREEKAEYERRVEKLAYQQLSDGSALDVHIDMVTGEVRDNVTNEVVPYKKSRPKPKSKAKKKVTKKKAKAKKKIVAKTSPKSSRPKSRLEVVS